MIVLILQLSALLLLQMGAHCLLKCYSFVGNDSNKRDILQEAITEESVVNNSVPRFVKTEMQTDTFPIKVYYWTIFIIIISNKTKHCYW